MVERRVASRWLLAFGTIHKDQRSGAGKSICVQPSGLHRPSGLGVLGMFHSHGFSLLTCIQTCVRYPIILFFFFFKQDMDKFSLSPVVSLDKDVFASILSLDGDVGVACNGCILLHCKSMR